MKCVSGDAFYMDEGKISYQGGFSKIGVFQLNISTYLTIRIQNYKFNCLYNNLSNVFFIHCKLSPALAIAISLDFP